MALSEQERQIVEFGKEQGRSKEQIQQSIMNFRMGIKVPQQEEKRGFFSKVADVGRGVMFASPGATGARIVGELPQDVAQTGAGIGEALQRRRGAVQAGRAAQERGEQTPIETGFQLAGQTLGAVADIVGEVIIGGGRAVLSEEDERRAGEAIQGGVQRIAQEPAVRDTIAWWQGFKERHPRAARNLQGAGGFTELLAEFAGAGLGARGARVAGRGIREAGEAVEAGVQAAGRGIGTGIERAGDIGRGAARKGKELVERVGEAPDTVEDIVGRVVQGKPEDITKAKRALSDIDTAGVETYEELNNRFRERVTELSDQLGTFLDEQDAQLGVLRPEDLTVTTKVGKREVTQNFVDDALNHLEELYEKTNDAPSLARIQDLRDKLQADGLTRRELNDLAINYGQEFRQRAFSKTTGDPLTSVNAQAFENTRKGVKTAFRKTIEGDTAKTLDSKMSDIFSTQRLTDKMETKVNALWQKVQKRGILEKLSSKLANVVDIVTFRTFSGFLGRMLPSNVGLKTMNAIDIEKILQKNLTEIDKLLKMESSDKITDGIEKLIRANSPQTPEQ